MLFFGKFLLVNCFACLFSIWKCQNNSEWQLEPIWQVHWYSLRCRWTNRRRQDWAISAGEVSHCIPSVLFSSFLLFNLYS